MMTQKGIDLSGFPNFKGSAIFGRKFSTPNWICENSVPLTNPLLNHHCPGKKIVIWEVYCQTHPNIVKRLRNKMTWMKN